MPKSQEQFWLIKAEPETRIVKDVDVKFSIDDLQEQKTTLWEGVRNYEARNNLKQMKVGDLCLYYHSNCKVPGIVGVARVIQQSLVDHSAFDEAHPYYDPKSKPDNPRWFTVQVEFVRKFERLIPLKELQKDPKLKDMVLLKKSRLSVQPTTKDEFEYICSL
ncbi:the Duf55 domain of thymocyte nuclear protein 1 [Gorgonomyces haynaldii]|nr:the Duf55 domain of thymocyte nuclear protein 1 [Gorgonomyces haynaldii]